MRFFILSLLLMLASSASGNSLLKAIAEVETGNNPRLVGRGGERSQYQICQTTWRRFSRQSFRSASYDQREAERVAAAYIEEIKVTLRKRGMAVTVFNIALMWNGGENRANYSWRHRDYATRVTNVFWDEERRFALR